MILDTDYITENGRPVIRVFKKENGEFRIEYDRSFEPYFYAILKEDSAIDELKKVTAERHGTTVKIQRAKKVRKNFLGRPVEVWKLYFTHPQDVPAIREKIREHPAVVDIYEYDIPFAKRYMIDTGITPMDGDEELKMLAFDIETLYHEGDEFATGPILMISYADEEDARVITWKGVDLPYADVVSTEKEMIKRFLRVVREKDPDVLITYNGDNFDFAYLKKRCERLGVKFTLGRDGSEPKIQRMGDRFAVEVKGRIHFDLYPVVRRTVNLPTYTLEAVYEAVLGRKKSKVYAEDIARAWESNRGLEEVVRYSMEDAKATYELGREFLPMEIELSRLIGQSLWDVSRSSSGNLVEWFLLRKAYERNELAPNKPSGRELEIRLSRGYAGAYVKEPERGLWDNIVYLDYKSLYPSIIITHNVSPDTLNLEGCRNYDVAPGVGHRFCKDKKGFIPEVLGRLLDERQRVKKKMKETVDPVKRKLLDYRQRALKVLANSHYGYMGYARARWYCRECAESITAWGREYIEMTIREIEKKFGFKVLYADSVTGDTEVVIRRNGKIEFLQIEKLFERVDQLSGEKEYCILDGVEALTLDEDGSLVWRNVPYVMRHRTGKRIYRIWLTNSWHLDVTEDHSLIVDENGLKEAKPAEIEDKKLIAVKGDLSGIRHLKPQSIEEISYDGYVYDIEVEGTHRFFANGILVHNTDGFFATIPGADAETVKGRGMDFLRYINSKLPGLLELEYEGFYTRGFFVTKKKYALIDEEGKITTRGLEVVRRDWSEIARETQARVLEAILRDGDVEEAASIVREVTEKLSKYEIPPEKLVIHEQITRNIRDYKAIGPHVALAKRLESKGIKVKPGTLISYIVLRGDGRISDRVILAEEFDPTVHRYDADYYIENQVLPAVERILRAFGYRKEDLRYRKSRQMGLGAWLGQKKG